jgi:hypothetical protein
LLAVRGLDIGAAELNPIASIDVLRWDANLLALYRGIEIPGHIDINELVIDTSSIDEYISIINTDSVFSNLGLSGILALQTLSVNSTVLIGDESVQLAPIELKRNKEKIIVSMENQPLITDSEMPKNYGKFFRRQAETLDQRANKPPSTTKGKYIEVKGPFQIRSSEAASKISSEILRLAKKHPEAKRGEGQGPRQGKEEGRRLCQVGERALFN